MTSEDVLLGFFPTIRFLWSRIFRSLSNVKFSYSRDFFYFNLTVFNLFWAHILSKTVTAPILFYLNIAFAPLGSLQFLVNLMTCFSIYVKMGGEILIEISYICTDLDSIDLSVCPLIQEHRMSSFLFGHFKFLSFIFYIFHCTSLL